MRAGQRYIRGEWEYPTGWARPVRPAFCDLQSFSSKTPRRKFVLGLRRYHILRLPYRDLDMLVASQLLGMHKDRFPTFDETRFDAFMRAAEADACVYSLDGTALAVSINVPFYTDRVVAAQLFAWDRNRLSHMGLGSADFRLQAHWYKALGFHLYALEEDAEYKRNAFGDSYEVRVP